MRLTPHARRPLAATLALTCVAAVAACSTGSSPTPSQEAKRRPPLTASASLPAASYPAVAKPNILVIETDDMRADDFDAMPNVEKLIADRGLRFQNSYAPNPLCCPSRASFLSGKYSHNHKVYSQIDPYGFGAFDDRTTIATVLQKQGYSTGLIGKYLNGYGQQPTHLTRRSSVRYVPPGWASWQAGLDHRWPRSSPNRGGTYHYFAMTQNDNGRVVPHPGEYSTDLTAQQTRATIDRFGAARTPAGRSKPWFVWWTPTAPHFGVPVEPDDPKPMRRTDGKKEFIATPARPDWVKGLFDDRIDHPPGMPPHGPAEADMSDKPRYLRSVPEADAQEKRAVTELARQRAEALYALDRQIGATLQRLRTTGQLARTLIVFTSDNGYFLGEHRKRQGKTLPHEPSLRVPLLIAGPGVPTGVRYDPATTIDLAPTFAGYAGTAMPGADGRDLRATIAGPDRGWDLPLVTEGLAQLPGYESPSDVPGFDTGLNIRGVRTGRYKWVEYASGETELYDLAKDPLEMDSVASDPAYAGVVAELRRVWQQYSSCAQAQCRVPLPADLRLTSQQNRDLTLNEAYRTNAFYQN
ncbi:sulfatase [Marmoricola endophyticus]|uniref:Sulfatase n=1 Tax=Marmoricola endophyticus TaxID=2040280 RepID=A0A917BMU3_9ACTN|nr:sulfatase [Marmoricola endophyticus]GGF52185.1 sulfatase [Marmoricola endophyticus]